MSKFSHNTQSIEWVLCEHAEQAEAHAQSVYGQSHLALDLISKSMDNVRGTCATNFMTCCQYQHDCTRVYSEVSKQVPFLLIKLKRTPLTIYEKWLTISTASEARYWVWTNSENCSHLQ